MPTTLPARLPKRIFDLFTLFAIIVGILLFAIRVMDPAPMDVYADWVAAP